MFKSSKNLPIILSMDIIPYVKNSYKIRLYDGFSVEAMKTSIKKYDSKVFISMPNFSKNGIVNININKDFPNLFDVIYEAKILNSKNTLKKSVYEAELYIVDRYKIKSYKKKDGFYTGKGAEYLIKNDSNINYANYALSIQDRLKTYLKNRGDFTKIPFNFIFQKKDDPYETIGKSLNLLKISLYDKYNIIKQETLENQLKLLLDRTFEISEKINIEKKVEHKIRSKFDSERKKVYLREKIKYLEEELNVGNKEKKEDLVSQIEKKDIPNEFKESLIKDAENLKKIPKFSQETTVVKNFLNWVLKLPWGKKSSNFKDIATSKDILENSHYGLDDVKQRIIEYMAVRVLNPASKGAILCLVGPPGVGKTSLAYSIAEALGRKFIRVTLGGVKDESEIRGHRKTYVASMPGKIMQGMAKSGVDDPVFLLDEIDKMSKDFSGDPASALLEVLDPQHNNTFVDHYINYEYDLSKVFFVATANYLHDIPETLRDRLEIVNIRPYTLDEKRHIADRYLIPKIIKESGLSDINLEFTRQSIEFIIKGYTKEAGVRNLSKKVQEIVRKIAVKYLEKEISIEDELKIKKSDVIEYIGGQIFNDDLLNYKNNIGLVMGLAWTTIGGSVLPVEVSLIKGEGKINLTGKLGDVMKESASIALTLLRQLSSQLGIKEKFYKNYDIHIHLPEGAIPKDGPSAGVTLLTALVSFITNKKPLESLAMTGEITLSGNVLPIGGLPEKLTAAYINGIKNIALPKLNKSSLEKVPEKVKKNLNIHFVENIYELIDFAFNKEVIVDKTVVKPFDDYIEIKDVQDYNDFDNAIV